MIAAQVVAGYSLVHLLIVVIVIAACCGILFVALRQFGIQIPPWAIQIFWIVVVCCVAIFAIRFVASM